MRIVSPAALRVIREGNSRTFFVVQGRADGDRKGKQWPTTQTEISVDSPLPDGRSRRTFRRLSQNSSDCLWLPGSATTGEESNAMVLNQRVALLRSQWTLHPSDTVGRLKALIAGEQRNSVIVPVH